MKLPTCYTAILFLALVNPLTESRPDNALPINFMIGRNPRTLLGTFPFNQRSPSGSHDHDHAHAHSHQAHESLTGDRLTRQDPPPVAAGGSDLNLVAIANSEEKCVEKVMMVDETVYDDGIECHHSYDQRCHTTYTTDYDPTQVEVCTDNFIKECYIEYKPAAHNETVDICVDKQVRDCNQEGPTVCETVYEAECETSYHIHEVEDDVPDCKIQLVEQCKDVVVGYETKQKCDKWPQQVCLPPKKQINKKYSPETKCLKKPHEVCGPGPCPLVAGPKECRQEIKTVVQEVPEEKCDLRVVRDCKHVTKLIPTLKPSENCVDVPKEVCTRVRTNPRKIKKPVIKKWCYVPTKESGLQSTTSVPSTTTPSIITSDSTTSADVVTTTPVAVTTTPVAVTTTPETTEISSEKLPQEQTSPEPTTTSTSAPETTTTPAAVTIPPVDTLYLAPPASAGARNVDTYVGEVPT